MQIKQFAALSLNPALDITMWVDGLSKEYNQVLREQCEAAGKAVNVARVLKTFEFPCKTFLLAGEENCRYYFKRLDEDGIDYDFLLLPGLVRENISVVQPDGKLTRLARPGFAVDRLTLDRVCELLTSVVAPGTLVVVAGKNPAGVAQKDLVGVCKKVQAAGGMVALDTSSLTEQDIFAISPWVIKPNVEELEWMTGKQLDTIEKMVAALGLFHEHGIQHILVSMGGDGLLYSGGGVVLHASVPVVPVKSTVGAGDSTLSGFLMAYSAGHSIQECVRVAASFGTASVLLDGTNPPQMDDLRAVYPRVTLAEVAP